MSPSHQLRRFHGDRFGGIHLSTRCRWRIRRPGRYRWCRWLSARRCRQVRGATCGRMHAATERQELPFVDRSTRKARRRRGWSFHAISNSGRVHARAFAEISDIVGGLYLWWSPLADIFEHRDYGWPPVSPIITINAATSGANKMVACFTVQSPLPVRRRRLHYSTAYFTNALPKAVVPAANSVFCTTCGILLRCASQRLPTLPDAPLAVLEPTCYAARDDYESAIFPCAICSPFADDNDDAARPRVEGGRQRCDQPGRR